MKAGSVVLWYNFTNQFLLKPRPSNYHTGVVGRVLLILNYMLVLISSLPYFVAGDNCWQKLIVMFRRQQMPQNEVF